MKLGLRRHQHTHNDIMNIFIYIITARQRQFCECQQSRGSIHCGIKAMMLPLLDSNNQPVRRASVAEASGICCSVFLLYLGCISEGLEMKKGRRIWHELPSKLGRSSWRPSRQTRRTTSRTASAAIGCIEASISMRRFMVFRATLKRSERAPVISDDWWVSSKSKCQHTYHLRFCPGLSLFPAARFINEKDQNSIFISWRMTNRATCWISHGVMKSADSWCRAAPLLHIAALCNLLAQVFRKWFVDSFWNVWLCCRHAWRLNSYISLFPTNLQGSRFADVFLFDLGERACWITFWFWKITTGVAALWSRKCLHQIWHGHGSSVKIGSRNMWPMLRSFCQRRQK